MVLNIFPRRERPQAAPSPEPEPSLPEPSADALEEPKKTRRGTRGGRGRRKPAGELAEVTSGEETPPEEEEPVAVAPRARRTRTAQAAAASAEPASADSEEPPARPAGRQAKKKAPTEPVVGESPDLTSLVKVIEAQGRQIEHLVRVTEEAARRSSGSTAGSGPAARVGVFVDSANVELAFDRLRARADWKKVLNLLVDGRTLVRATAYSPVHDDPGVSIETQRFAEPFLGKGFKVVTKPLKRFADGSIKANVDIEMALDIIEMLDRLDVVCLVSGDGDFQRLVEVVQGKGVRVEVVAVGSSIASELRHAADQYIDLQPLLSKVRA